MDRTAEFLSCVSRVRASNGTPASAAGALLLPPVRRPRKPFYTTATTILGQIEATRRLVTRFGSGGGGDDVDVDVLIRECCASAEALCPQQQQQQQQQQTGTQQVLQHERAVSAYLIARLQEVAETARAHRLRRASAELALRRPAEGTTTVPPAAASTTTTTTTTTITITTAGRAGQKKQQQHQQKRQDSEEEEEEEANRAHDAHHAHSNDQPRKRSTNKEGGSARREAKKEEEEEEEERDEELEAENEMLVRSLQGEVDALRRVERQVREIGELQRVLAEKALEQASDIDTIAEQADKCVEHVHKANEVVEQASRRSMCPPDCNTATVMILLFFSLVLLFFNWLHP